MMFSDLSRRERAYSLNSVVTTIEQIGKNGSMLADVSNVLELGADTSEFLRYARAC